MEKIINFFYLNENKSKFPKNFNKKSNIYKLYILSSFCYLFIGVLILTVFKNTVPDLKNILFIQGILLIIQSIFTYFADVKSNGKKSNLHIYDRLIAIFNTIFVISNILWLPPVDVGIYIITLITGLLLLKKSRNARHNFKFKKYVMYHSLWHLWFPLGLLFWLLYNYFNNINYKNIILLIVFISNSYIISLNGFS
tara:strand:+ start:1882 stop:2469 length:588 start_codon:yes stop_codon:yes gene_type:complete